MGSSCQLSALSILDMKSKANRIKIGSNKPVETMVDAKIEFECDFARMRGLLMLHLLIDV